MADRIAIKRLTQSDLTFVDYHYQQKTFGNSKQKAINLNRRVLIDSLFPDLARSPEARLNVLLTVYGPAGAAAFTPPVPVRPILNNNAKNWRLNGRTLPDDPSDPQRFQNLDQGDLAVMVFRGWPRPEEVDLTFVSAVEDATLHAALNPLVGPNRQSMSPVTREMLQTVLEPLNLETDHSLITVVEDDRPEEVEQAVDDVVHGGISSEHLRRRRGGPRLTPVEFAEARNRATQIGEDGEEILHEWLLSQQEAGRTTSLDWVARRDAAAPYDFEFIEEGATIRIDAKSTSGPFSRRIHVSIAEIYEAAKGGTYRIARVYDLSEDGAKCRICNEFGPIAQGILDSLALPSGVTPNGFSILPDTLLFEEEIDLFWSVRD